MFKLHRIRLKFPKIRFRMGKQSLATYISLMWNCLHFATGLLFVFITRLERYKKPIHGWLVSTVAFTRTLHPLIVAALLSISSVVFAGTIVTIQSNVCGYPCTKIFNISTTTTTYNSNPSFFGGPTMPWFGSGTLAQIISKPENIPNTYVAYSHGANGVFYFYNGNWSGSPTVPKDGLFTWAYVMIGPDPGNTQSSLRALATSIRSLFSSQTAALNFANMNTYDCDVFDRNGACISVGAQSTRVDGLSHVMTAGVVVGGYQISPYLRVGAFFNEGLDYDVSPSIQTSHNSPLFGAFAVWNDKANHSGLQIRIATAFQSMDAILTRPVIGSSQAGSGETRFSTQSFVGELSYAYLVNDGSTIARPYAALRYTRIRQNGYTEFSDISAPLTFNALKDSTLSALMGVKLEHKMSEQLSFTGSLGFEHDVLHHTDNLSASGVSNLTSETLNTGTRKTRLVGNVGAQYRPAKNQVISAEIAYQQLPFDNKDVTIGYLRYTIGF